MVAAGGHDVVVHNQIEVHLSKSVQVEFLECILSYVWNLIIFCLLAAIKSYFSYDMQFSCRGKLL